MKRYNITYKLADYGWSNPEITIDVDNKKFDEAHAQSILENINHSYDSSVNLVDEAVKMIAVMVVKVSTEDRELESVLDAFKNRTELKHYPVLDGSVGITLIDTDGIEFDEDNIEWEVEYTK